MRSAIDRLTWLALAAIVLAIFAVGLAEGQDDWHAALVLVGGALQAVAVLYATRGAWLPPLQSLRARRPANDADKAGPVRFALTQEDGLVAGGMMIAGVILTLAGNLLV
jgi:hypothetical protein